MDVKEKQAFRYKNVKYISNVRSNMLKYILYVPVRILLERKRVWIKYRLYVRDYREMKPKKQKQKQKN